MTVKEDPATESPPTRRFRSEPATEADEASVIAEDAETVGGAFAGYELSELLGRGGMGEVLLGHDGVIGREVAIKRLRHADPSPEAETRFLREAKIQARLQHPAIVPVHELGRDDAGRAYFTMKRLAGRTLHDRVADAWPQQRLLRAFAEVCLAIEFAHEHGVVHRDIKPGNIMLGDFGEVYVLDWGIALVAGDGSAKPSVRDIAAIEGETQVGAVMGTPGYMPPEQALGYQVTPAVDVYALGCVLFEILTGRPLHPRGTQGAAHAIAVPCEAPSARRPELAIAPELDAACVAALAEEPRDRPTARELGERIQDYLDGDRDLERRRQLAAAQLAVARAAVAAGDRAAAVSAAGRAVALDPESIEAQNLVTQLIVEPPAVLPPALVDSLTAAERDASRVRSRTAMFAFCAALPLLSVVPFVQVKSWPLFFGFFGAMLGMAFVSWLSYRRGTQVLWISLTSTFITTLFVSRVGGPFLLTPLLICGIVLGLAVIPGLVARPWLMFAWIVAASAAPVVLEALGWFAPTWWFDGDTLRIRSQVLTGQNRTVETVVIVATHVAFIAMSGLFTRAISKHRQDAERRLHIQAWHLRHLLPGPRRETR